MDDRNAVTPDEPDLDTAEERARWIAVTRRDVRRRWRRPILGWSLAALIVPLVATTAQIALTLYVLAPASDDLAAFLMATSPWTGALAGVGCISRLPLSLAVRCVLGVAYFVVVSIAATFLLMLLILHVKL